MRMLLALTLFCMLAASGAGHEMPRAVDDRLVIELFAKEPDIVTPTSIAVDERGRLLVIECHTHFRPQNYVGPPTDRVRVFEDTDGDGHADRISTFFEGTQSTMSLALDRQGRLYVATRNEIFRLRDADGDGHADEQIPIVTLRTTAAYPHNGLAGFAFDFAGNLFFGMGENLGETFELVGSDGSTQRGTQGGHVFRCSPDGAKLERFATGLWNPFHMAFDPFGRLFAVDNDPHSRPPCRLLHVVPGGNYGFKYRNGAHGLHPFTAWNGENPGTLPMVAGVGEAPCGVVSYQSDGLPADYQGNLLITSWGDHRLERVSLEPRGASFRGQPKPFIAGGESFRPVGIAVAPDGSLFVSDWVDKAYEVHGKGRLWHIKSRALQATPPVASADAPAGRVGREPGTQKLYFPPGALTALQFGQIVTDEAQSPRLRAAAMTALGASGRLESIAAILQSKQAPVELAQYAWSILGVRGPTSDAWRIAADQPPEVRAGALRAASADHTAELWTASEDNDPFIAQAARLALARLGAVDSDRDFAERPPRQRLAALLILRESSQPPARLLAASLADADPQVRFAALQWVGEDKLSDYRGELTKALTAGPMSGDLFAAYLAALENLDAAEPRKPGDKDRNPEQYVAQTLADEHAPTDARRWALRVLRADHPLLTLDFLRRMLDADDVEMQREAIRTLAASPHAGRIALLAEIARDPKRPPSLRAEATAGVPAEERDLLLELAASDCPPVEHEAMRGLAGATLDSRQRAALEKTASGDPQRQQLIARVLDPRPASDRPAADDVDAWVGLLAGPADADEGGRVFNSRVAGCSRCHTLDGRGGQIGPDLSLVGRALERRRLIESILRPSKEIAPQYVAWNIETSDGQLLSGLLLGQLADGVQTYVDLKGTKFSLPAGSIEHRTAQPRSAMPDGLERTLTVQEFRDLLAFLKPAGSPTDAKP
ncbi:MAG TPA: PVC-type heme-binding CxxCH protein [Pirellulales bacterium]|jgi:putative membrane-bound dehydrogenase-like protein|nr:PVC-type heme-binding CxxCH protein [Pirellulales bacterium]